MTASLFVSNSFLLYQTTNKKIEKMENIRKRIERLQNIAEDMTELARNSVNDLQKNTVAWAVVHQFYSEALDIRSELKSMSDELNEHKRSGNCGNDTQTEAGELPMVDVSIPVTDDDLPF